MRELLAPHGVEAVSVASLAVASPTRWRHVFAMRDQAAAAAKAAQLRRLPTIPDWESALMAHAILASRPFEWTVIGDDPHRASCCRKNACHGDDPQVRIVGKRRSCAAWPRGRLIFALAQNVSPISSGSQGQARHDTLDAVRRQQFAHFGELARIVGRDHELACDSIVLSHLHYIRHGRLVPAITFFFNIKEKADARVKPGMTTFLGSRHCHFLQVHQPRHAFAARPSAQGIHLRERRLFRGPCTSIMRPSPVMTKLSSVSASNPRVIEIEHRGAGEMPQEIAATLSRSTLPSPCAGLIQPMPVGQCDPCAGDRGRTGATIACSSRSPR